MSEKALDSQIEVDTTLAHGDVASVRRGQWQSTVVVAGSVVCALVTALLKAPWEVSVAFLAAPVFEFGSSLVRAIREPRRDSDRRDGDRQRDRDSDRRDGDRQRDTARHKLKRS